MVRDGDDAATAPPKSWEMRAAMRAFSRAKDEPSRAIPSAVIRAARELVGEAEDFTVKDVAERAGVALQTVYRQFGSKDEIVMAVIEEVNTFAGERVRAASAPKRDPVERLRATIMAPMLFERDEAARRGMRFLAREQVRLSQTRPKEIEVLFAPYREALASAIREAVDAGAIASEDVDLDADLVLHLVLTMTHVLTAGGFDHSARTIAEQTCRLCLEGIATRAAPRARAPRTRATRR